MSADCTTAFLGVADCVEAVLGVEAVLDVEGVDSFLDFWIGYRRNAKNRNKERKTDGFLVVIYD